MEINTERLTLREYKGEDLNNYYKLKSCAKVWRYSTFKTITSINDAAHMLNKLIEKRARNEEDFMALIRTNDHTFIGEAGIISSNKSANRCVVGYNLLPQFWGQGYATEITKGIIKYAFEILGYERVEALALADNVASCKVLKKSGFLHEGTLRHFTKLDNEYGDVLCFGVISSDFVVH